jgi:hypothetical protein
MIKLVNILESITENQVTKGDWGKADGEQRVDWLLQIFDDVDEAEKHFETEWEDLPNEARDFMKISESVNEGFTKHDWDVKWKTPKDNLFNVTKTVDSVNNRYKAIQDLLKLNPKELQAFDATDDHPAYDMSYDELMRWYYQIMKESVNEEQLKKGDVLIMKATGQKWKIVRPHGDGYYVRISGENSMGWHPSDWFDMMLRTKKAAIEGGIKESVNEGSPGYSKFIFSLQTLIGDIAPNAWEDKSQIDSTSMKRIHNSLKKRYGDDYAKYNDLLKTQKGQFGWWYLKESVNEDNTVDLWTAPAKSFRHGMEYYKLKSKDIIKKLPSKKTKKGLKYTPVLVNLNGKEETLYLRESVNEAKDPVYKKGDKVLIQLTFKGGVGKFADSMSKSKNTEEARIVKRIKNKITGGYKYELSNHITVHPSEIVGLAESVNEELSKLLEKIKGIDGKACWKGYKYAGTKDGKDKCVPMNEEEVDMSINEVMDMEIIDENITEAKFKGKTVTLNKPTRGDSKKFKVYVNSGKKNADGSIKVKKVNFGHGGTSAKKAGQKTMSIRKSNPKARSAFRARHNCDSPGPKTMARYWSCKKW